MDLKLSRDIQESFRLFQGRIIEEYEAMAEEAGFHIIDATDSIEAQQKRMREIVMREMGESLANGVMRAIPVAPPKRVNREMPKTNAASGIL